MFSVGTENVNRPEPMQTNCNGWCVGLWRFVLATIIAVLSGCATVIPAAPAATVPMPFLSYRTDDAGQQPDLLVLLRGYGEDNTIFAKQGIIDEIRNRHLPFDVIAPDAHFGYYRSQTFETRLKEDIIDPAHRRGYEHIWLAGFSMGGLGCLLYLRQYPNDVDGVLLTSPFLGWSSILHEINRAGGVEAWHRTSDDPHDWERMIWSWIKYHDFAAAPPVWMGYGDRDDLVSDGPPLLATLLPAKRVFTVHGEHDIATFKTIFLHHLDTLARRSPPVAGRSTALASGSPPVASPTPPIAIQDRPIATR